MTRVVVPHTAALRPETVAALRAQAASLELVDVSQSDVAYWELFSHIWQPFGDLVLVEQDVVLAPEALRELNACPRMWCSLPSFKLSPNGTGRVQSALLQANRWRKEAIGRYPDLFTRMPAWCRHWLTLDQASLFRLAGHIGPPHEHWGLATHLQDGRPYPKDEEGYTAVLRATAERRLPGYYRWLARFAPSMQDIPAIWAQAIALWSPYRSGMSPALNDDHVFHQFLLRARWMRDVLTYLGPGAEAIPPDFIGDRPSLEAVRTIADNARL